MQQGMRRRALAAAFPHTVPILAGFLFLGMAYGIYMNVSGFSFWYPMLMGLTIFGGSLEFVAVSMLLAPFAPLQTFLVALMLQARHLFYGIAMLEKYRGLGLKRYYLIFGMCDESFSINYTAQIPPDVDRGWFMFFVTLLNHIYWVTGATLGALLGYVIHFDTTGIEFVMTALFVVMFLNQWEEAKDHRPALVGVGCSLACLLVFGSSSFIVPAMALIILSFLLSRRTFAREEVEAP